MQQHLVRAARIVLATQETMVTVINAARLFAKLGGHAHRSANRRLAIAKGGLGIPQRTTSSGDCGIRLRDDQHG
jgi:hypothetical protein